MLQHPYTDLSGHYAWCRSNSNLPVTSPVLQRQNANAAQLAASAPLSDLDFVDPDLELVTPPPVAKGKGKKRKISRKPKSKSKRTAAKKLEFSSDSEVGFYGGCKP